MTEPAIHVQGIGKRYRLQQRTNRFPTLRDAIAESARRLARGSAAPSRSSPPEIWALRHVSFDVPSGEAIAIIGQNGAGKSTLLKVLSRITLPTEGEADVRGRVGSLLEVGTGFHHELTGRDNVYLNGAILGMRRAEIARKFDEIIAFAEVERFVDTPVKFYSSGMSLRLAFAVAAHLEPEILFIDEVLAVGDAAFQRKCLGKMRDVTRGGRTILFVSHNMSAVQSLCSSAIWLRGGEVAARGRTSEIVSRYLASVTIGAAERRWDDASAPASEWVRLHRAAIRASTGDAPLTTSTPFEIEFEYSTLRPGSPLLLSIELFNQHDVLVFGAGQLSEAIPGGDSVAAGRYRDVVEIPGDLLNDGVYRVSLRVARDNQLALHEQDVLVFEVHDAPTLRGSWFGEWPGAIRPRLSWRTTIEG